MLLEMRLLGLVSLNAWAVEVRRAVEGGRVETRTERDTRSGVGWWAEFEVMGRKWLIFRMASSRQTSFVPCTPSPSQIFTVHRRF